MPLASQGIFQQISKEPGGVLLGLTLPFFFLMTLR